MTKPSLVLPLLIWLLAGCTELAGLRPQPVMPAARPAPARVAKPVPPAKPQPPAPEAARFEPQHLMGRDAVDLVAQLGLPEATSEEPPATIWRYQLVGCSVDLFLYPNVETRSLRALSYKVDGPMPACQANSDDAADRK